LTGSIQHVTASFRTQRYQQIVVLALLVWHDAGQQPPVGLLRQLAEHAAPGLAPARNMCWPPWPPNSGSDPSPTLTRKPGACFPTPIRPWTGPPESARYPRLSTRARPARPARRRGAPGPGPARSTGRPLAGRPVSHFISFMARLAARAWPVGANGSVLLPCRFR